MPIFTQSLQRINEANPQDAIKKMAAHIQYIQEQLEYTLLNLDSRNINEIDMAQTNITNSSGSTTFGSFIHLTGADGASFTVGENTDGVFEFSVKRQGGTQALYLNSSGEIVITEHKLTIDGGEW
jgi:hypothetical protein